MSNQITEILINVIRLINFSIKSFVGNLNEDYNKGYKRGLEDALSMVKSELDKVEFGEMAIKGQKIKELRKKINMTMNELAYTLNCKTSDISSIENGRINNSNLPLLEKALKCLR